MTSPKNGAVARLKNAEAMRRLAHKLEESSSLAVSGLWGSAVAGVVGAVTDQLARPMLLVCGHVDEADDLADDVELFTGERPTVFPPLELGGALGRASEEAVSNRLRLLERLAGRAAGKQSGRGVIVTPIQALMQAVVARRDLKHHIRTLMAGESLEPEKLIVWLSDHGYNRLDQCEVPGDFAVRGGIIDVFIPGEVTDANEMGLPVRIDFFGDQIESLRTFDVGTLGSGPKLAEVQLPDLSGSTTGSETGSLLDYLHDRTVITLWAPLEIQEQAKSYIQRAPDQRGLYPLRAVLDKSAGFARLELSQFDQATSAVPSMVGEPGEATFRLPVRSLQRFETQPKQAMKELAELVDEHDVTVFCENEGEAKRFGEMLDADVPGTRQKLAVEVGYLHRGFVWGLAEGTEARRHEGTKGEDERPILMVGHHELFHRYEVRRRTTKRAVASKAIDSFSELKPGDYVVHVAHGIAKFTGIQTMARDGRQEEFLTLRFDENAVMHVPASRINLIQKYVGGFQGHPKLSRLGSGAWEKQKEKVAEAVMDMASELLEVQAARNAELGLAYPADTPWQKEFEEEFPYTPTADQETSAVEIKQDMQNRRPMDRLLCGDVGYGKTELAMRAAFKAVEYGKQVAVLVPTTVLAEQHERSFRERMINYPFVVESVSRFKTNKEAKEILKRLEKGDVDVIIGTHRLLSKDVKFADLGLVVVDEEQRFGVTHKEKLKQLRSTVDVLTMSATPIPRTLHMSMLGLRDISSLTTAPQDRRSIVTEVMPYSDERIKLAILRELQRQGQVYFVHNRVHNIQEVADRIQQMVPDARVIIGHGQMDEGELEQVMHTFILHEADILVSTTIIESGLDIPNANTMIINNADRFGLSELHQLRGRVGRYKHRAYCYLLLPADRPVTPVAAKRLKAIEEYSHLGAGFKIAMRDLELRGAGNILGPEQSGHIAAVGYELYCQLLEEAVQQLKDEGPRMKQDTHVEIGITALVPKEYITSDRQRMDVYRRLTRCTSIPMLDELKQDVVDAFGEMPKEVSILFMQTELRLLAGVYGIQSIIRKDPDVILKVIDAGKAQLALTGAPGTLRLVDDSTVYLRMPKTFMESEPLLITLRNLIRRRYDKELTEAKQPEAVGAV